MSEITIIKEGHEAIITNLKESCQSKITIDRYVLYGNKFEEFLIRKGLCAYDSSVTICFQRWIREEANNKRISQNLFKGLMRYSAMINDFYDSRLFQTRYSYGNRYKYILNTFYESITDEYVCWLNVAENSKAQFRTAAREFFFFLQERNIQNFAGLNTQLFTEYLVTISRNHKSSMNNIKVCLRKLLDFLEGKSFTTCNRNQIWKFKTAPTRVKVYPAFTDEDLKKLLLSPDRSTDMGKRDYAILFLASVTGLRAIDIANLQFENMFWDEMIIRFSQHKTGRENVIPIDATTISAIGDYLSVRPDSNFTQVFLTCTRPVRKMGDVSSVRNILVRYTKMANISKQPWDGKGFHAFRRGMGLWLLENSCNTQMIFQILGHKNDQMLKHYLPMSADVLRVCALDSSLIPMKSEVYK